MRLIVKCVLLVLIPIVQLQGGPSKQEIQECDPSSECVLVRSCPEIINPREGESPRVVICGYQVSGKFKRAKVCCLQPANSEERTQVGPDRSSSTNDSDCGKFREFKDAIIVTSNKNATPGAWPWMVAIVSNRRADRQDLICSGFLITRRHVLSAAHCFERRNGSDYGLRIGNQDWRQGRLYTIQSIKVNEKYRAPAPQDDIAILTMTQPADDPMVNTICLPGRRLARKDLTGLKATVASWSFDRDAPSTNFLHCVHGLKIISNADCEVKFGEYIGSLRRGITSDLLCTGHNEDKATRFISSGGPLMLFKQDRWYAVGLASFGVRIGGPAPDGFTRLSHFLDWIQENIKPQANT